MTRLSRFLKFERSPNSPKTKITDILFKDLARTSQNTLSVSHIKTDQLPLYKKIGKIGFFFLRSIQNM